MQKNYGLTLIEVLIALAIVSIALTAIIKATSQSLRNVSYLETKSESMWVAQRILNELRVGLLKLNDRDGNEFHDTVLLGSTWYWKAGQVTTPNPRINKIFVKVFASLNDEIDPTMTLESYIYNAEPTPN